MTSGDGKILAVADGRVVNKYYFYSCSGGQAYALIIDHGSYVINYGEINGDKIEVDVGDQVKAGQYLGGATNCGMLHMELYQAGTTKNHKWLPPSGKIVEAGANYCRDHFLSTKPDELMDPTETLKDLRDHMCSL